MLELCAGKLACTVLRGPGPSNGVWLLGEELEELEEELEAHSESNQLSPLLCDFARELLKQRLLRRVEFVRVIELSRRE